MPKTYIAKALTALSLNHSDLCENIAQSLNAMPSSRVNSINKDLDLGWLSWSMRNVYVPPHSSRDEIADKRRAAMLLVKIFKFKSEIAGLAESWEQGNWARVFAAAKEVKPPRPTGYYLKGSFWGFSNHSEREWTRQAWNEAGAMIHEGIQAAYWASIQHEKAENGASREIFMRYFGVLDRNTGMQKLQTVQETLRKIQNAMRSRYVGFSYQGMGVPPGTKYKEAGIGNGGSTQVLAQQDKWGDSNPACIGLAVKFFLPDQTAIGRNKQHNVQRVEHGVSRAGALVHELSHHYAGTQDRKLPDDSIKCLFETGWVKAVDPENNIAYGPTACWALARSSQFSHYSLDNADSYRCFCEDASVTGAGTRDLLASSIPQHT